MIFSRADTDYDPSRDPSLPGGPGLAFRAGDILYVTNAADDSWWQARRVTNGQGEEEMGIIPSKSRIEKRERARQKRVNFNPGSNSRVRNNISFSIRIYILFLKSNTLDRDKKKKKKGGLFTKSGDKKDAQSGEESENELDNSQPVPSFELVIQHDSKQILFYLNILERLLK